MPDPSDTPSSSISSTTATRRHPAFWPTYQAALTAIFTRIRLPGRCRGESDDEVLELSSDQIEAAAREADLMAVIVVEHYARSDQECDIGEADA